MLRIDCRDGKSAMKLAEDILVEKPKQTRLLRINYVMPRPNLGGGIKSSKLIAEAMMRRGHDVRIIYVNQPVPLPPVWKIRRFARRVIYRLTAEGRMKSHHLLSSTAKLIAVPKLMIEPADVPDGDVCIASWWETMEWISAWPASKGLKVHFIRGHEIFHREKERVKSVYLMNHLKVTNSQWLARVMAEDYGRKAVVVHNGVDWSQFDSLPRKKNDVLAVGFMVGLHPLKGAHTAFESIRLVQQTLPNLRVVAFGLEKIPKKHQLPANFEYHCKPDQKLIPQLYRNCDCWIIPSVTEGLPMPGLEAAGCRCPVVATRCGGSEDYVQDGINGYLVPVENPTEMARRLLDVLNADEKRWSQMSEASYRIARTFDWDQSAAVLEKALVGALEEEVH
jgi:glycosyltransferase involved in cell wall biosynthesis